MALIVEENRGQADARAKYLARTPGYTVFFTPREVLFVLRNEKGEDGPAVVHMRLAGASPTPRLRGLDLLPGRSHYYIGRDPRGWRTNIPQYARVQYSGAYAGIDLEFHGSHQQVEFDLVVHPGADASSIELEFDGAEKTELDASGALIVKTPTGELRFEAPGLYQDAGGKRQAVSGAYLQKGDGRWGFQVGDYDRRQPLVIDPVIRYATFLPSSEEFQMAVDPAGGILLANSYLVPNKAFLTKIDSSGTNLAFSISFGGSGGERISGVATDKSGNMYVAGSTTSADFPTTPGVVQRDCPSPCASTWVAKFSPSGMLEYSTLLEGNPLIRSIAVDPSGQVYLAGSKNIGSVPLVNPIQPSGGGFVQKLKADGSGFVYSTYLGRDSLGVNTTAWAIAADANGDAYVAGVSNSPAFPLRNPVGVSGNIFLMKIVPDGGDIIYSTKLGDSPANLPVAVSVDAQGNAIVAGSASGPDFPLTPKAFQTTCYPLQTAPCGGSQIFVLKVNSAGTGLVYSTLLGGGFNLVAAADAKGNAYLATNSGPGPALVDPVQKDVLGVTVAKLDPFGIPVYVSRLGSTFFSDFQANSVAADDSGNLYAAGKISATTSEPLSFPLVNPIDSATPCCGGINNAFVVKISPQNEPAISISPRLAGPVTLRNVGTAPLQISSITANDLAVTRGDCGSVVSPGESCLLDIPTGTMRITITSNAPGSPHSFQIGDARFSVPEILARPEYLYFGTRLYGHDSPSQTVTVSNPRTTPLTFQLIRIGADFEQTNDCGAALAPGARCKIRVTHRPGSNPGLVRPLEIFYNNNGSAYQVGLIGSTSNTAAILSTSSIDFGRHYLGGLGLPRLVTVANVASDTVSVTGVSATGDFAQTNDCTTPLPPGGMCYITLTFAPTSIGTKEGKLTVTQSGPGGTLTAMLSGVSLPASDLTFTPIDLPVFNTIPGVTTFPLSIVVKNEGSDPVDVISVTVSGEFAVSNQCPTTLSPGGSCVMEIRFAPSVIGPQDAELRVVHTGNGSPLIVPLHGEARTPLRFNPEEPNAGEQVVGGSKPFYVGAFSASSLRLTITGATATGDFSILNSSCPDPIFSGSGCGIGVAFTPTATGLRAGTVTVTVAELPEPSTVTVSGTGISAGAPTLSPAALDFGRISLGSTSSAQTVTLTNSGSGPLVISGIEASTFYNETHTCGAILGPGESCAISVRFAPGVAGMFTGTLAVKDDASGSPRTVGLLGSSESPAASLSPTGLGFSEQEVGTTSSARDVSLSNVGNLPLLISGITASGDFSQTTTCGGSLEPGEVCLIHVTFRPTTVGVRSGSVAVTTTAPGSPHSIPLGGSGVVRPAAGFSKTALTFGMMLARTTSGAQEIVLTNGGGSPLNLVTVSVVGEWFNQTNDCPAMLAPGATCRAQVTFTPATGGVQSAALRFESNAPGSPHDVSLSGIGTEYVMGLASGGSATATVDAGQTANYPLVLSSAQGSQERVNLTCSGAPLGATCTVSPPQYTFSGTTSVDVAVTVTTRARAMLLPRVRPYGRGPQPYSWPAPGGLLLILLLLTLAMVESQRRRLVHLRPAARVLALAGILLLLYGCGGGGDTSSPPPPPSLPGTPAGPYTLTVTAAPPSSASQQPQQTMTLTLVVR